MNTIRDALQLGAALAIPAGLVIWALIEWRGRHVFATRQDLNGVGKRVDNCEVRGERIETMAENNRERLGLLEAGLKADRERITETVAEPIKEIRKALMGIQETLTTMRVEHGSKIAQHDRDLSALGRGVDELRGRVEKVEAKGT